MTDTDARPTPGKWMPGHLIDDDHNCDCTYILTEGYMGAVATVHVDDPEDSLSDYPPEEEAQQNMKLIAAAGNSAQKLPDEYDAVSAVEALPFLLDALEAAQISLRYPHAPGAKTRGQKIEHALKKARKDG